MSAHIPRATYHPVCKRTKEREQEKKNRNQGKMCGRGEQRACCVILASTLLLEVVVGRYRRPKKWSEVTVLLPGGGQVAFGWNRLKLEADR